MKNYNLHDTHDYFVTKLEATSQNTLDKNTKNTVENIHNRKTCDVDQLQWEFIYEIVVLWIRKQRMHQSLTSYW